MGPQFDTELDFSEASLTRLDGMLQQLVDLSDVYRSDRPDELIPVALAVCAYVGEVIRRSTPDATWITEPDDSDIPPPHLRLAGGMRLNLMKKAIDILNRADSPSFTQYVQTVRALSRTSHSPDEDPAP